MRCLDMHEHKDCVPHAEFCKTKKRVSFQIPTLHLKKYISLHWPTGMGRLKWGVRKKITSSFDLLEPNQVSQLDNREFLLCTEFCRHEKTLFCIVYLQSVLWMPGEKNSVQTIDESEVPLEVSQWFLNISCSSFGLRMNLDHTFGYCGG